MKETPAMEHTRFNPQTHHVNGGVPTQNGDAAQTEPQANGIEQALSRQNQILESLGDRIASIAGDARTGGNAGPIGQANPSASEEPATDKLLKKIEELLQMLAQLLGKQGKADAASDAAR